MSLVAGSGTSRNTNRSLQDDLGMNDWMPNRPVTGAGALQRDLDQAVQEHWNAGEGWSDWVGGDEGSGIGGINSIADDYAIEQPSSSQIPMMTSSPSQLMQSQNMISSTPPIGLSGSSGSVNPVAPISIDQLLGVDPNAASWAETWEANRAEEQGRPIITTNVFGEEFDDGGRLFSNWDNQLNLVGNTRVNDAYLRDLIDSGRLNIDEARTFMDPDRRVWSEEWKKNYPNADFDKLAYRHDDSGNITNTGLDDGLHNDWMSITADAMTGTQYKHYRDDLGMGGRDDIDLAGKYSKRLEQLENGFMPFTPRMQEYVSGGFRNAFSLPARLGSFVSDIRSVITPDYQMEYSSGGDKKTISGRAYDRAIQPYVDNYYHDMQYDKNKFLTKPEDGTPYDGIVKQFEVPDVNGNPTYHYGIHLETTEMPDGTYQMAFSDGSTVRTSPEFLKQVGDKGLRYEQVPLSAARELIDEDQLLDRNRYQYLVNEYVIPDAYTGEDTYHYVAPSGFSSNGDGTYALQFADGSVANLTTDWIEQNLDEEGKFQPRPTGRVFVDNANTDIYHEDTDAPGLIVRPIEESNPERSSLYDNPETAPLAYYPSMVMDDGTVINSADALRLWNDKSVDDDKNENGLSDDDIHYNLSGIAGDVPVLGGIMSMIPFVNQVSNKPRRLGSQELVEDGNINWADMANNAVDFTAGSLPISIGKVLPWVYSFSTSLDSLEGGNHATYNPSTGYEMLNRGGYDENGNLFEGVVNEDGTRNDSKSESAKWLNWLGNLTVPGTEMLVGPIGEAGLPIGKVTDKFINPKSATGRWLKNMIVGSIEEGIEENLGNVPEELTQYGLDAFAEPVINEKTNEPMKDLYGNEIRGQTSDRERLGNMAEAVFTDPNAFLGGALVSSVMQSVIPHANPETRRMEVAGTELMKAINRDLAKVSSGADRYIPASDEELENTEFVDLGDKYASLFDNMIVSDDAEDDTEEKDKWRRISDLTPMQE